MLRYICLLVLLACLTGIATVDAAHANEQSLQRITTSRQPLLVPLPPVTPTPSIVGTQNSSPLGIDGTWRQEGSFLVINLNGQQLRLANDDMQTSSGKASSQVRDCVGEVFGRLSHQGRPLVGCDVTLIPLRKTWVGYQATNQGESKPLTITTNATGVYHFASVPPGRYKLQWRPAGKKSWIRRAEIRPDVHVRASETATIKEIRVALRTIN